MPLTGCGKTPGTVSNPPVPPKPSSLQRNIRARFGHRGFFRKLSNLHAQRGQSLPVVAIGLVAMLACGYFALDYANTIRWQIRAQTAADAAAQAILTIQTQEFNEMTAALYAAAVEEYRLRRNLNAMAMAANQQGGCVTTNAPGTPTAVAQCATVYAQIQPYFLRSVARYGADVLTLNKITASLSLANISSDSKALLKQMVAQCNGSVAGDCAFNYVIPPGGLIPRSPTYAVQMDALRVIKPAYGSVTAPSNVNPALLAPIEVEVDTCATIPPVVSGFFGYHPNANVVIGRGAATAVMTEEDWMMPGTIVNPYTTQPFQPPEQYLHVNPPPLDPISGYDWYNLNFGGNGNHAYTGSTGGYSEALLNDEFTVQIGWWNSIPIHTFIGAQAPSTLGCTPT